MSKIAIGKPVPDIERSTFLIDEQGVLRQAWHKVKVKVKGQGQRPCGGSSASAQGDAQWRQSLMQSDVCRPIVLSPILPGVLAI